MKKLLFVLLCACVGFSAFSAPISNDNTLTEQLSAKPITGYVQLGNVDEFSDIPQDLKVILVDWFGNEDTCDLIVSQSGNWFNIFEFYTSEFGFNVRFYFKIEDQIYGACGQDIQVVLGDQSQNPLTEYSSTSDPEFSYYTVQSGYSYVIGVNIIRNPYLEIIGFNVDAGRLGPIADPYYHRGDVDGDKAVNITDVTTLIDYMLSGSISINKINADVDYDGKISISDVTELIDMLLN